MIPKQFRMETDDHVVGVYWNKLCKRKYCFILAQGINELQVSVTYNKNLKIQNIFMCFIFAWRLKSRLSY